MKSLRFSLKKTQHFRKLFTINSRVLFLKNDLNISQKLYDSFQIK